MNLKWLRRFFVTVLLASVVLISYDRAFSPLAAADGDDEVDGVLTSQNFNNAASFTDFILVTASGFTGIVTDTAITPQQSYTAKLTINDPDDIRDLRSVEIRFYNSTTLSGTPSAVEPDFNSATATNVSGQELVIRWNYGEDGFTMITPSGVGSDDLTWVLSDSSTPTGSALLDTSYEFTFTFEPSKVAQESSDGNLRWFFGAIIQDGRISLDENERTDQNPTTTGAGLRVGEGYNADAMPSYWKMNWYGEISVNTSQVTWTDLPAGITFGAISKSVTTISGITYIANGDYDSQITADKDNWQAVMTASLAAVLFDGFTTSDFDNFEEKYKENYATYAGLFYMPETGGTARDIGAIADMVGIPYAVINDVSTQINTGNFNGFSILLPLSIEGVNQTGAAMVVVTNTGTDVNYADLIDGTTDEKDHQFFAISYKDAGQSVGVQNASLGGETWYLVGAGSNQWRSFNDEAGAILNTRSYEVGQTGDLALYIHLSDIFQNAEYRGEFQLKIVNR